MATPSFTVAKRIQISVQDVSAKSVLVLLQTLAGAGVNVGAWSQCTLFSSAGRDPRTPSRLLTPCALPCVFSCVLPCFFPCFLLKTELSCPAAENFTFAPGFVDPFDARNASQTERAVQRLGHAGFQFTTYPILEVNGAAFIGIPGSLLKIEQGIASAQVSLLRSYVGGNNTFWFDVGPNPLHLARAQSSIEELLRV